MRKLARIRKWLRELFDLNSHKTAGNFLWRAVLIALPLAALVLSVLGGSLLGAALAGLALALATANGLWPLEQLLQFGDIADGLGIIYIALLGLIAPALLIVCSPFVLIWALVRAGRLSVPTEGARGKSN